MNKKVMYCQCRLEQSTPNGVTHMTSYIPQKYAVVNKVLKLKDNGEWTDGWIVKSVGVPNMVPDHIEKLVRDHRRRTGDSLPKERINYVG